MKKIYCNFNLFDQYHRIYLVGNGEASTGIEEIGAATFEELGQSIAFLCEKYDVENVHLTGNVEYGKNISEDIFTSLRFNKNKKEIIVEVN